MLEITGICPRRKMTRKVVILVLTNKVVNDILSLTRKVVKNKNVDEKKIQKS